MFVFIFTYIKLINEYTLSNLSGDQYYTQLCFVNGGNSDLNAELSISTGVFAPFSMAFL